MHWFRLWVPRVVVGLMLVLLTGLVLAGPSLAWQPPAASHPYLDPSPPASGRMTGIASATPGVALDFRMTADPTAVHLGDVVTYSLRLATRLDLEGVTITDPLPDGAVYVPGTASAGQYDPPSRQIIWDVPALSAGEAAQLTFRARMTGPPGREVLNRAMAQFKIYAHDHTPCCGNRQDGATIDPETEWQLYRMVYHTDGSGQLRINLTYLPGGSEDKVYVDNVTVAPVDTTGDERTVHRRYVPNTTAWIVDRVAQETVYAGIKVQDDDSGKVSQTRYHYDATTGYPESGTVPRAWDGLPGAYGLLSQVDRWNGAGYDVTGYRYDAAGTGNRVEVTDPLSRTTTTGYDGLFHTYPVTQTNALGQVTTARYYGVNGASATGSGAYFGQIESVTDPNGATTTYAYDVFGRRTAQRRPGDASGPATVAFIYTDTPPYRVQIDRRQDASTVRTSYRFYDGLGRLIETKTPLPDGEQTVQHTTYNAQGLVAEEYVPYAVVAGTNYVTDTTKPRTSYAYDALGRV